MTGGTLVAGGERQTGVDRQWRDAALLKGDVFIVPAGSPHWFSVVDVPITYLEVRWVAPK